MRRDRGPHLIDMAAKRRLLAEKLGRPLLALADGPSAETERTETDKAAGG